MTSTSGEHKNEREHNQNSMNNHMGDQSHRRDGTTLVDPPGRERAVPYETIPSEAGGLHLNH